MCAVFVYVVVKAVVAVAVDVVVDGVAHVVVWTSQMLLFMLPSMLLWMAL